jgi:hypothetical protein
VNCKGVVTAMGLSISLDNCLGVVSVTGSFDVVSEVSPAFCEGISA